MRLRRTKERIDDWDKSASLDVDATPRRSTSSLGPMILTVGVPPRNVEIPDEWWAFCEMDRFVRVSEYFPYIRSKSPTILSIRDIEPPSRDFGIAMFKKYKLVPVLLAFHSPECALPPVSVDVYTGKGPYKYSLKNGLHRFYASVAVGFSSIPVDG